jgi:hypothetical protein
MNPHRNARNFTVLERLYNKKLRRGWCVVENTFGILKQRFQELLVKSDLDVLFLLDVITCCAILHNILLGQSQEGLNGKVLDEEVEAPEVDPQEANKNVALEGDECRQRLAVYLVARRII